MWFDEWDCFADVAQLLLAQARRRGEQFSLLLVAMAGEPSVRVGGRAMPAALQRLISTAMPAVRSSDPAAPYDQRCLAVLALNSNREGTERLVGRIKYTLAGTGAAVSGIATAPEDGATLAELLARAEGELEQALAG